ncbi:MAG: transposase [Methanothrix sp.]|nr:transposase [Methanothrix sp.]
MTVQVLPVQCKMSPTYSRAEDRENTLKTFEDACNWIDQDTPAKLRNNVRIQSLVYQDVRAKFGLSANLVIRAINRVAANRKMATIDHSTDKNFEPLSIDYDAPIFAFREKDKDVSVTLSRSRQRIKQVLGAYPSDKLRGAKPTSAMLCKNGHEYYINIQVKSNAPNEIQTDKVLDVDLGVTDMAVTSEGQKFGGETIKKIKRHYQSMRAVLQQKSVKGTRSSRKRCRELQQRLSGKESRYQRQINHEISKAIVTRAHEIPARLALEDLAGIREGVSQKARKNQRPQVNGWAFYQLKDFGTYKALQAGIFRVLVDPAYTSQTCHVCGEHRNRHGKSFKCPACGWSVDADLNGAQNIDFLGRYVDRP